MNISNSTTEALQAQPQTPELKGGRASGDPIRFTRYQTASEKPLSKSYHIEDGKLITTNGGMMHEGTGQIIAVRDLSEFRNVLEELTPHHALCYGIPRHDKQEWKVCTKNQWEQMGKTDAYLPRTNDHFVFPDGPGILQMDFDPEDQPIQYTPETLVATLIEIFSEFKSCRWLAKPSNSSGLTHSGTGELLKQDGGFRLYFEVTNARAIPATMKIIDEALWAFDLGWIKLSASGSLLPKTPIDMSVYQTNRLDFAGPPLCVSPVTKTGSDWEYHEGGRLDLMSLRHAIENVPKAAAERMAAKKAEKRNEAEAVKKSYIHKKAIEISGGNLDAATLAQAERTIRHAVEGGVLAPDFVIEVEHGDHFEKVAVGKILSDPQKYDGSLCLDPIEPEYHGNAAVGKIYLNGGRPNIHSFAHGGRVFHLKRKVRRIEVISGHTADATDSVTNELRLDGGYYEYGQQIAEVHNDRPLPFCVDTLRHILGSQFQFYRNIQKSGTFTEVDIDPPEALVKTIIALGGKRGLPKLRGVVDHPVITPDGRLLDRPGYDIETELYLGDAVGEYMIPPDPSPEQTKAALNLLWTAFKDFPFVSQVDAGVFLAALLSSVCRVAIGTCPAFGLDAPEQGSGKTLLALCCGALMEGDIPPVMSVTMKMPDEEIRKRVFAVLLEGGRCIILDNILGVFDSATLAGALTSQKMKDRILGVSKTQEVPNKALYMLTGNNILLAGDMPRRVFKARIDAKVPDPARRKFELDPLKWVIGSRKEMIEAGLTLLKGRFSSGFQEADDSIASFEEWDKLVRQTVRWISTWDDRFADPVKAVEKARSNDPYRELLGDLLLRLVEIFGETSFDSRTVRDRALSGRHDSLFDCLKEITNDRDIGTKKLGNQFSYRLDRTVYGLSLADTGKNQGSKTYKVRIENEQEFRASLKELGVDPELVWDSENRLLRSGRWLKTL
jgi:hypothetical protein